MLTLKAVTILLKPHKAALMNKGEDYDKIISSFSVLQGHLQDVTKKSSNDRSPECSNLHCMMLGINK